MTADNERIKPLIRVNEVELDDKVYSLTNQHSASILTLPLTSLPLQTTWWSRLADTLSTCHSHNTSPLAALPVSEFSLFLWESSIVRF